ncbi:hypothetical protein [Anoxynatronum buryatiense]|uniref:Chemotaxis protein CheX n=1 Tax=Anoxynatronum buryatiense TaxID=489973 RepID=A0AA45WWT9_9CLOT|nr:hypothetical protein [Anoxynatronum buryatiense]SMP61447.1 hypothetical protein SAMN06296020_10950 [Anoxynatronum buryatiense]
MLNLYFGSYLLQQRLIDPETLRKLLKVQRETHLRLGVLAMQEGLMTAEQVKEINDIQRRVDALFGEVAVQKGYLNQETVDSLLQLQKRSTARLTQLLLDHQLFTYDELEAVLKGFREYNQLSADEEEALERGNVEGLLAPYMVLQCQLAGVTETEALTAYGSLFLRNMIRFIDHETVLDIESQQLPTEDMVAVKQAFSMGINIQTALMMEKEVYQKMAEKHARMPVAESEELMDASVLEFLNLHNGLYSIWLSDHEIRPFLEPPTKWTALPDISGDEWIKVPLQTAFGQVMLLLKVEETS